MAASSRSLSDSSITSTCLVDTTNALCSADASYDAVSVRCGAESLVSEDDADTSNISPSVTAPADVSATYAVSISDGVSAEAVSYSAVTSTSLGSGADRSVSSAHDAAVDGYCYSCR